ncbi:flagellar basal body-associated protein FliL [Vreelandella massiliensis]|uniref:flagellar basal body-associated protein FliL n=1 Tax=Vreelandella massiliensis TaxID=1816686 RepID=UPI00096A368E|nr:flagellar basal body-associated protein FliL [Halomonas massiliensis]MYL24631.1 flagellar basal body-associated protein FliL [Halomonas alkaliantarctica]
MAETSGGSKKLLWVMILLVLLSSAGAAAAIYMVMNQEGNGSSAEAQAQVQPERQSPIFLDIEPFTVNLESDRGGSRLLYTGITLRVGNEQSKEILAEHMPQVRSRLLMLLSGKKASELTSPEGKRALSREIIDALSEPLAENQAPLDLREVLFTEFIVQ